MENYFPLSKRGSIFRSSAAIAFYWIAMRPNSALTFDENDQKKKKETVPKEEAEVPRGEVLKKQIGEDNKKKKKKVVTAETFSAKINFQTGKRKSFRK